MTMKEKQMLSASKEVEKLQIRIQKLNEKLLKKEALAVKHGCSTWDNAEWRRRLDAMQARHPGQAMIPFGEDDDLITEKQNSVMWDLYSISQEIKDERRRLEISLKKLQKLTEAVEEIKSTEAAAEEETNAANAKEDAWTSFFSKSAEDRAAEYQKWLKWFKAECLKDGVEVEEASSSCIYGKTKSGKKFFMYINSGFTTRSRHCYSLTINGATVFTSGDFTTAYAAIKR